MIINSRLTRRGLIGFAFVALGACGQGRSGAAESGNVSVGAAISALENPVAKCQSEQVSCLQSASDAAGAAQCAGTFRECLGGAADSGQQLLAAVEQCRVSAAQCAATGGVSTGDACRSDYESCVSTATSSEPTPTDGGESAPWQSPLPAAGGAAPSFPSGPKLPGGGFPDAGLPGAGLPGAGLPGAGLPGAGLPAGFPDGGLPGAGLPGGGLPGAGLPGAGLPGAGLPGAGLPGAGLPGGGLPAGFPDGGLPGAGLPGAGLPGAGLPGAGLPGAGFPDVGLPDGGIPGGGFPDVGLPGGGLPVGPSTASNACLEDLRTCAKAPNADLDKCATTARECLRSAAGSGAPSP